MSNLTFRLTDETKINAFGVKLFRIEATVDIPARGVKKGDKGGWVESETVSNGNARISDDAWVSGNAWVFGNARISGDAWVSGNAEVFGNAKIFGNAEVSGNARISGDAWVSGNAVVYGNAWVFGNARVYGNAVVYGNAWVSAKKAFTKGLFIGGDDTGKITDITDQTGSDYWKNQYVLGDYEIKDIEEEVTEKQETIDIGGKTYQVTDELKDALRNLKEAA